MPYNLLLLPLLGGFLFIHLAHYFRFGAQRLDGYRLLFQSAIAGVCLAGIARVVIELVERSAIGISGLALWFGFFPFKYSAESSLSLVLGPISAGIVNLFMGKKQSKDREIHKHGNALMKLLHRATEERLLISVTLDNRKWYVGWVTESPNLDPQELYFRLLPFTSGYRDKDTLETFRTVFYQNVLEDESLDPDQFFITLPLKDIKTANLFDADVYNQHFAEADKTPSAK
ncbi:MAG TPA: hypothetical protein VLI55_19945 [Bryobacteraceae bacterium]|nr:hypothetical protein [Bryobacteraceae bacterium]